MSEENKPPHPMSQRFRGFLPVVVDVETAGFNPERDALLEIAAVILTMDDDGLLRRGKPTYSRLTPSKAPTWSSLPWTSPASTPGTRNVRQFLSGKA